MRIFILLLALFCSMTLLGQDVEEIKLNVNIQDQTKSAKSLNLIDLREVKEIGFIKRDTTDKVVKVAFQKEEKQAIKDWFNRYNQTKGKDELHLVLRKLNISQEDSQNKLEVSAGVFAKEKDKYHYISKVDTVLFDNGKTNVLVRVIPALLGSAIKKSYKIVPWKEELSQEDLLNYEEVMKQYMPAFSETNLKDGVYKNYYSFFRQTPEEGNYTLVKDENGQVLRAVKEDKTRIPARQFSIYVENGKAYKRTLVGFVEMKKDEKGYYIMSNHASLFPVQSTVTPFFMFGALGGVAGGIMIHSKNKKEQAKEKSKYYIDHLTGYYMLEQK